MLPASERQAILKSLTPAQADDLLYDWEFWGRPEQIEPAGNWSTWLALAGRGWGKTEAGAQWIRKRVANGSRHIALVAETQKDLEEVMVPRIIAVHPPHEAPSVRYKPVRLTWPNGAVALGYNGTEPDQLRGPEFDTAWVDELAKYKKSENRDLAQETWDMLQFTMRKGNDPRVLVTTTPRPRPVIRAILKDRKTVVSRGSTFDNAANLPASFLQTVREKYEGTRLGRQELFAEILDDVPGALWTRDLIRNTRDIPPMQRVVVAVDPSGASGDGEGDSIGICVAGKGIDGKFYVLEDATCDLSPAGWGRRVVERYHAHKADRIVAEKNFGGAMVESVIRTADRNVPIRMVTASRGKSVRAEPVAALYEQGRVMHSHDLDQLEDQMLQMTSTGFVGEGSPDRLDAMVWAITDLMGGAAQEFVVL